MISRTIQTISRKLIPFLSLVLLVYYCAKMGWSVVEFLCFSAGIVALWAPVAMLLYVCLRTEVSDRIVRGTLSGIASYALTTLAFFGFAVLQMQFLFYVGQIIIVGGLIMYTIRQRFCWQMAYIRDAWRNVDWVLVLLIVISLLVNIPYKTAFLFSQDSNTVSYILYPDHLYHTGQAYELARHIPPQQASIRAGSPERAYHNFLHVTTMLIARFTRQVDLLRAHLVYHYTIIEILMCFALYSLAKLLTHSQWAGYIAISSMYLTAISWQRFIPNGHPFLFYFTLFPHRSSGLEPVISASPQMYSGLIVMYGIFIGIALMSLRLHDRQSIKVLLGITALMVAATFRFRVHIWLVMFPGFLLLMLLLWVRLRQKIYLSAAGLSLVVSILLYGEMRSAVYLGGTNALRIGYNALTKDLNFWVNSWPFALATHRWLSATIKDPYIFDWVWQAISMSAFVILNMIGFPLLIAAAAYLATKPARHELALFSLLICWLPIMSTLGGMVLTTDYDNYAVGGQLLLHTRWYLFPCMAVALWPGVQFSQRILHWPRPVWLLIGSLIVIIGFIMQQSPSKWMMHLFNNRVMLSTDEWLALRYLHDETPQNAVILSSKYVHRFIVSGMTGRAAYLELSGFPVDRQALKLYPEDDRLKRITELWKASDENVFCRLLQPTPVTHLVENADQPLQIKTSFCMHPIWQSPQQEVTIWQVQRQEKN